MKKIRLLLLCFIVTIQFQAQSTKYHWVKRLGGQGDEVPRGIALDKKGNVFTTGSFLSSADFDPGPSTYTLISYNPWYIFVSKLDTGGHFVWAQVFGDLNSAIIANSITTDTSGNVYITGQFDGPIDFDSSPAYHTVVGHWEAFVLKLSPGGNFLWLQVKSSAEGKDVAVDAAGNCYFTGVRLNQTFVSKLDPSGNYVWDYQASSLGGASVGASIGVGDQGNVFIAGNFDSIIDFDPGTALLSLSASAYQDAYILKLNTNGTLAWVKPIAGKADEFASGIALDKNENCYTTGTYRSLTDFDPGPASYSKYPAGFSDCFILKWDANGNFIWMNSLGGSAGTSYGQAITVDQIGNVYTTSAFFGTLDRYSSNQIIPLSAGNYDDAFISMSDPSGNFLWAKQLGAGSNDMGMSIAVDSQGSIFSTGCFQDSVDFDTGPGTDTVISYGIRDVYIHKMSTCQPNQTMSVNSSKNVICVGETATLTVTGASTFTWDSGSILNNLVVSPPYTSFYFVYSMDNTSCVSSASIKQEVNTCVGITTHTESWNVKVYPNPGKGQFSVLPDYSFERCSFELMNSQGRLLHSGEYQSNETMEIDLSDGKYISGLYFLRLNLDGKIMLVKLILQK